jgi:protein SCO1
MRGRPALIGLTAAAAAMVAACTPPVPPTTDADAHGHDASASTAVAPGGMSLFQLDSRWRDADGRVVELRELARGPMLIALVYTHCTSACPRIVQDMKRVEAEVASVHFVLISIDPERDTPQRMRQFAAGSRLDPGRWTLLSGSDDDLLVFATALGVRHQRGEAGEFAHSNVITAVAEDGTILFRQERLGFADETIRRLRAHGF